MRPYLRLPAPRPSAPCTRHRSGSQTGPMPSVLTGVPGVLRILMRRLHGETSMSQPEGGGGSAIRVRKAQGSSTSPTAPSEGEPRRQDHFMITLHLVSFHIRVLCKQLSNVHMVFTTSQLLLIICRLLVVSLNTSCDPKENNTN